MSVIDIFSKRQKKLRGEVPDVYIYNNIPMKLRVQTVHIWGDCLGSEHEFNNDIGWVAKGYEFVVCALRREYGVFSLAQSYMSHFEELKRFILREEDTEKVIDAIEMSFRVADKFARQWEHRRITNYDSIIDNSIIELNCRFKEHGVGYQFENGEIIRVDSQLLHAETVKPALTLLNEKDYSGVQQEFLSAYEHYRHGKHKEALNDALKSFESTMKAICEKRKWPYSPADTSKKLIDICYQQGLIPAFWQSHMAALRSLLEGGVPTGRNKLSGHGQGSSPTVVPEHIVAYILHMTAACIVFLIKSEKSVGN